MSVSFALIMFGALLIVAGWSNVSLSAAARGDNTVPKGPVTAAPAAPSSAAGSSPQAQGKGGPTVGKGGAGSSGGSGGAW